MGKKAEPPPPPPPFVWPAMYRPKNIVIDVPDADNMTDEEYNKARLEIPWQFRGPMRQKAFFIEVEDMRPHVFAMLEAHKETLERQRQEELAAKAAAKAGKKKGKGRPGSAAKGGKPNPPA